MPLSPHVPDLAALELFVAVARYGSIGAAARHTGISQQAASARLRAMESQVGTALLDRDPRGSRLTAAGALLVDWAAPLLAQAGELDSGIASLRRARDAQLRVAASLTIAEHLLPAWLVALRDEYEQAGRQPAEITLVAANSEAVAVTVAEHGVDLGFVEGPVPPRGLRSRVVAADRLAVVVRPDHPWARRRSPVRPAELAATPLVEREEGSGTRQSLRAALTACLGPWPPAGRARPAAEHHHGGTAGGPGRGGPGRAEPARRARERGGGAAGRHPGPRPRPGPPAAGGLGWAPPSRPRARPGT